MTQLFIFTTTHYRTDLTLEKLKILIRYECSGKNAMSVFDQNLTSLQFYIFLFGLEKKRHFFFQLYYLKKLDGKEVPLLLVKKVSPPIFGLSQQKCFLLLSK